MDIELEFWKLGSPAWQMGEINVLKDLVPSIYLQNGHAWKDFGSNLSRVFIVQMENLEPTTGCV